jgi:phage recombination protein Bet
METQIVKSELNFTDDQVKLIKSLIAPQASNDELQLFLYQSKRTGLDPLTRQIYCIHRYDKTSNSKRMTIQTSIDGFRVVAERSGEYGGQDEPEFVHNGDKLLCCKIKVYKFRGDQRYQASVGVAYWDEYVPAPGQDYMWKKMPHTMLAKVAEALALRKAFPQDLSGLYTAEEMQQADAKAEAKQEPVQQAVEVEEKSVDDLHKEYMTHLNLLIHFIGDDANRYHPDNWKKEKSIKTYKAAISDIIGKISQYEMAAQ